MTIRSRDDQSPEDSGDCYTAVFTDGIERQQLARDALQSDATVTRKRELALTYAEYLSTETPLTVRQAQTWVFETCLDMSLSNIAELFGIDKATVHEHAEKAVSKVEGSHTLSHTQHLMDAIYMDYPSDARPAHLLHICTAHWSYEQLHDSPVRHSVETRWFVDIKNSQEIVVETTDVAKSDTTLQKKTAIQQFTSLSEATQSWYEEVTPQNLAESVTRWAVIRDFASVTQPSGWQMTVQSPAAMVENIPRVGILLDFVDDGMLTVDEANRLAEAQDTSDTVSIAVNQ